MREVRIVPGQDTRSTPFATFIHRLLGPKGMSALRLQPNRTNLAPGTSAIRKENAQR